MNTPKLATHVVRVRFHGPTNFKGARWSAQVMNSGMSESNGPVYVRSYNYDETQAEAATKTAQECYCKFTGDLLASAPVMYGHSSPSDYMFFF